MNRKPPIAIDPTPFMEMVNAIKDAVNAIGSATVDAFRNLDFAPILESIQKLSQIRPMSVTERLDWYGWQSVDASALTPDERWEYQKWVMRAPVRWVRRFRMYFERGHHDDVVDAESWG